MRGTEEKIHCNIAAKFVDFLRKVLALAGYVTYHSTTIMSDDVKGEQHIVDILKALEVK